MRKLAATILVAILLAGCAGRMHHGRNSAKLSGTLWWITPPDLARNAEGWKADLDAVQKLGMDTMILNGPWLGAPLQPGAADPAEALLTECDRRGIRLFLDTLAAPNWWVLPNPYPEIMRARERIALLQLRYSKHVSFHGWYVPYELYVFWGPQSELIKALYREVAQACKLAAPDKPVLISPFFILDSEGILGDFRWATPDEYAAFWTDILAQAPVDIVALQDSGEHLSCYTVEDRAPFFKAMKNACDRSGKQLWANIESGELDVKSMDDYVARFGMKTHVNDPRTAPAWRAVPPDKMKAKLKFAGKYTPMAITWGYREFIRPANGPLAQQVHDGYYKALR